MLTAKMMTGKEVGKDCGLYALSNVDERLFITPHKMTPVSEDIRSTVLA